MSARFAMRGDGGRDGGDRDRGSALIEFSVASLILLVPLIYLIVTLGRLQAASYAATSAATAASTIIAHGPGRPGPSGRAPARTAAARTAAARTAAALALRDHGFAASSRTVTIACDPACTEPRAVVTARVRLRVSLPGVPPAFDDSLPTHITVSARHHDEIAAYGYRR